MPVFNRISGGGVIIDATALPSDVASGKIFYNNNGRQVGTNEAALKYRQKIFSFRKGNTLTATDLGGESFVYIQTYGGATLGSMSGTDVDPSVPESSMNHRLAVMEKFYAKYINSVSITRLGKTYDLYLYQTENESPDYATAFPILDNTGDKIKITKNIYLTLNLQQGLFLRRQAITQFNIGVGFAYSRVSSPEPILEDFDVIYTYVV